MSKAGLAFICEICVICGPLSSSSVDVLVVIGALNGNIV